MPQSEGGGSARELRQHHPTPRLPSASDASTYAYNTSVPSTAPSVPESTRGRTLTYEDLSRCFHLPINAAAKELGVCVTALKKQCRKHGVPRWPHRKLKSLDKLKEKLEKEEATAADKEYYKHEIHSITQKKDHIFRSNSANAAAAAAAAAGSGTTHGNGVTAPLPHLLGGSAGTALHGRAGPQLMMGHPMAHYPAYQIAQNPLPVHHQQATSREDTTKLGQGQHVQQPTAHAQQRIITGPMVIPIAQLPGAAPTAIAAPNGALIPQPIHGVQPYPHWGVYDPNNAAASNPPVAMHGMHFYNPTAYAYAPTMNGLGPYQNMVQVNVMEQSPYGVAARDPNQPAAPAPAPAPVVAGPLKKEPNVGSSTQPPSSNGAVAAPGNRGNTAGKPQENAKPEPKQAALASNAGYEMYGSMAHGATPAAGQFMYSIMPPHNLHYEGMAPHQNNGTPVHGPVPAYWTEIQHTQTPSNMVTMCNQTVHHHHHHGTDTASPSLLQKDPAKRQEQQQDTASAKTSSERAATSKTKDAESAPLVLTSAAMQVASRPVQNILRLNAAPNAGAQPSIAIATATATTTTTTTTSPRNGESVRSKSVSSQIQSESKCANSSSAGGGGTNGYHPSVGIANGVRKTESEETSYSSRSNENDKSAGASPRRPNKRARTQTVTNVANNAGTSSRSLEQNRAHPTKPSSGAGVGGYVGNTASNAVGEQPEDTKGSAGASGRKWASNLAVPNGKPTQVTSGTGSGKDQSVHTAGPSVGSSGGVSGTGGGSGGGGTTANTVNRARRYDHVVHQCLALASAQWCTDENFKVSLALGPKLMLGLAGVPSLGKSVLDGTDNALEDRTTTRNKYLMATRGQRLEWVANNGNSRYLMVMNPFRKRNSSEISGVSGLIVELKIVQALSS